jgi:glutathione S-transferase
MTIMKLYGFPPSPNTWKVRAVIAHLGLPIEEIFVDLMKGEQTAPSYLALNPTSRTPTLVDGDFALWESTAIMNYLASKKPSTLWPDDAKARADVMRWQSWHLQHWGPQACEPLIFERLVKGFINMGPADPAAVEKALHAFEKEARVLDAHLATRSYLVADKVTVADFSVVSPLVYAKEAELPIASYPNVQKWSASVLAMPAWRDSAPPPSVASAA